MSEMTSFPSTFLSLFSYFWVLKGGICSLTPSPVPLGAVVSPFVLVWSLQVRDGILGSVLHPSRAVFCAGLCLCQEPPSIPSLPLPWKQGMPDKLPEICLSLPGIRLETARGRTGRANPPKPGRWSHLGTFGNASNSSRNAPGQAGQGLEHPDSTGLKCF